MNLKKEKNKTIISLTREEVNSILVKNLLNLKTDFTIHSNLPYYVEVTVNHIPKQSKRFIENRREHLKKVRSVSLQNFIQEFRDTTRPENKKAVNQFCNVFDYGSFKESNLEKLISQSRDQLMRIRGIGKIGLGLFEPFLNKKGFRFAIWNGKELI